MNIIIITNCLLFIDEIIVCFTFLLVYLNGWALVYELSGYGFESRHSQLIVCLLLVFIWSSFIFSLRLALIRYKYSIRRGKCVF